MSRCISRLEKAKEIVERFYDKARCGIFDCNNLVGDRMTNVYRDDEIVVDVCYDWQYFEVFGLSDEEFDKLVDFYEELGERECSADEEV